MRKTDKRINYEKHLRDMQFPGNPMLIHRIQDAILALTGGDHLSNTAREAAQNKQLKGAINLIRECSIDNKRMALELFGNKLVADVLEYWEDNQPQPIDDMPVELYKAPGLFGYLAD